ncbi:hypothetical protein BCON_0439g00040 [Botryotinia convoluta]|uniref:Uncharacterized protein n=1 Tax=Botryotinia convoluta TaxID=54673 RepID=A0A4Z1HIW6_9HELO|nr:hypothetical protein BCON_0439g00040 [Botryotinia convoluta]
MFLEESKLDMQDWRWALKSFLHPKRVLLYGSFEFTGIPSLQKEMIDLRGLRAWFSGYGIKIRSFDDSKPKDPWPGFPHVVEYVNTFADEKTGKKCHIFDKSYTLTTSIPITGDASINPETVESGGQRENGLVMKSRFIVVVSSYTDDSNYLYEVFGKLAHEARNNEITDLYLSHHNRLGEESNGFKDTLENKTLQGEEYKAISAKLNQYFIDITQAVIDVDERLSKL